MSQTMQPPAGGSVVPFPQPGAQPAPPMSQPRPNPAYAQWQQQQQAQQAVIAANQLLQQQFDAACALIRKDGLKGFKLDIEADSTIAPDEQAEKQARIEFLQQMVPFMETVAPIAQGNPQMAELVAQVGLFAVRGFRVARTLEDAFEKAFDALGKMPPPPPKGAQHAGAQQNPQIEMAKIKADQQDTQTKAQVQLHDTNTQAQIAQETLAQKQQQAAMQTQADREKAQAEDMRAQAQMGLEREKLASTERVAQAREANTLARSTSGLV